MISIFYQEKNLPFLWMNIKSTIVGFFNVFQSSFHTTNTNFHFTKIVINWQKKLDIMFLYQRILSYNRAIIYLLNIKKLILKTFLHIKLLLMEKLFSSEKMQDIGDTLTQKLLMKKVFNPTALIMSSLSYRTTMINGYFF